MHVGLFFGSFNPIHVGHMVIANALVEDTDMDQIWFVVSPQNPHKKKASLLDENHRLNLVREAVEDNPKLRASNIEFKLPQPSYTVNTLAYLSEEHPDKKFSLIMGEDNLRSLHKWKNAELIINDYDVFVYPRTLTAAEQLSPPEKHDLLERPNFHLVDLPIMNISASAIRKAIKEKRDVRYVLTEPVYRYVMDMHFYE